MSKPKIGRGRRKTEAQKQKFLEAFREICIVTTAAKMAGMCAKTVYNIRDRDPVFRAAMEEVEYEVQDKIETEIRRRAMEGVDKPIFYQGKVVGTVKEYSDRLIELLAKGHMKDRYGDQSKVEMTGKDGTPLVPDDRIEIARRIAWALSSAVHEKKNRDIAPEPKDTPSPIIH